MSEPNINNTIECPFCGTEAYYELTRCPNCGRSFYPVDDDEEENVSTGEHAAVSESAGWLANLGASALSLLAGWFVAFALGFLLLALARNLGGGTSISTGTQVYLWGVAALSAAAGGYISGYFARRAAFTHGLVVALAYALSFSLLQQVLTGPVPVSLFAPASLLTAVLIALGSTAGVFLFNRLKGAAHKSILFESEYQLYQKLLLKVRYDKEVAGRLIAYERTRQPRASQAELIARAIDRLDRDNR